MFTRAGQPNHLFGDLDPLTLMRHLQVYQEQGVIVNGSRTT